MAPSARRHGESDQGAQERVRFREVADAPLPRELGLPAGRTARLQSGGVVQEVGAAGELSPSDDQDDPPSRAECGRQGGADGETTLLEDYGPIPLSGRLAICHEAIGGLRLT